MKILAFTDVHGNPDALATLGKRSKQADILVCAGDLSIFGNRLKESLVAMNSWGKPVYFIHGNHEDAEEFANMKDYPNLHFVHATEAEYEGIIITGWGGGGFTVTDPGLERFAQTLAPHPKRVLLFHGPPHGTNVDNLGEWAGFVGCKSRRLVIEKLQPMLVVTGHIHETTGKQDKIGRSIVINPGPLGVFINFGEETTKAVKPAVKKKASKKKR